MSKGKSSYSTRKLGQIFRKTDGHCAYCGQKLDPFGRWHVEHKLSRRRGGTNDLENLVAACSTCNLSKRHRTPEEFRVWLRDSAARSLSTALKRLDRCAKYSNAAGHQRINRAKDLIAHALSAIDSLAPTFYLERIDDADSPPSA